ncbi:MAG: hypothetical protein WCH04_17900 [Gammaproteobacteria bacterium]
MPTTNFLIEYAQRFLNSDNPGNRVELQIEFRKRLIVEGVSVEDAHIAAKEFHYAFLQKDEIEMKRYLDNTQDICNKYDKPRRVIEEYAKYLERLKQQSKPKL